MVIWHFFCHVLLCFSPPPFQQLLSMEILDRAPAKVEHPWLLGLAPPVVSFHGHPRHWEDLS